MSKSFRVALFIGSLRRESYNRRLALALDRLAPATLDLQDVRIDDLPPYNQDQDDDPPPACRRLKQDVESSDALLFVTPEYNRSIPGVLKNAIDIASRPYGHNSFAGKPAGVIGASIGTIGTALAQQHLRNILAYLDVAVMGQPEAFIQVADDTIDPIGHVTDPKKMVFLQHWIERYGEFTQAHLERRAAPATTAARVS